MGSSQMNTPLIAVLTAPGEPPLPGLESIEDMARILHIDSRQALADALEEADILVVTDFRSDILRHSWPQQHHLRWVHATSAGVDALQFDALIEDASAGLVITNARGVFDRGIAEYVLGAVLLFAKDTLGNLHHQREHRWVHRETALIHGQRALVVGAGSIGHEVAGLLTAAGLQVEGVARSARTEPPFRAVHADADLPELLPRFDHVVITAPLTARTHHLFDAAMFARMRPGACLINVGRGPIVDTAALVDALRQGILGGAALDVFEEEPLPTDHPLWDMPGVMLSAHMAGDFKGWRRALGEQFAENFQRWQRGEALHQRVELGAG